MDDLVGTLVNPENQPESVKGRSAWTDFNDADPGMATRAQRKVEVKKVYVIANPKSGTASARKKAHSKVRARFEKAGVEVTWVETTHAGHAKELGRDLPTEGYDGMIIIGGDGSLHELVNGMLSRSDGTEIPIGVVAGGSGNSMAFDMADKPTIDSTIDTILNGRVGSADAAKVNYGEGESAGSIVTINMLGWGIATDVARRAEANRWLGPARYNVMGAMEAIAHRKRAVKVTIDGVEAPYETLTGAIIMQGRFTGKGMKMAPHARFDDDKFDLIILKDCGRLKALSLLGKLSSGAHIKDKSVVDYYHCTEVKIEPADKSIIAVDGELMGATPFEAVIMPRAYEIFM